MSTPNASNQRQTQLELEALRNRPDGDDQSDIVPQGYLDEGGLRRPVPGDADTAWLKTPPFESSTQPYVRGFAVPAFAAALVTDFAFVQKIDVTTRRLLNLWITWTIPIDAGLNNNTLGIIPQALRDTPTDEWFTIAVVDPALTANSPIVGYGARTFYDAELQTPAIAASAVAPVIFRTVLTFDVSIYSAFRFGFANLSARSGTLLDLDYSFSD